MSRFRVLRRALTSSASGTGPAATPPPSSAVKKELTPQEIAAAFQQLGDKLKIPDPNEANDQVFAQYQQARDMRDLVKKRYLDKLQGDRYSEVDLQHWFTEMDRGNLPKADEATQAMFQRFHQKYKWVQTI